MTGFRINFPRSFGEAPAGDIRANNAAAKMA
jgi:hypothetical protein